MKVPVIALGGERGPGIHSKYCRAFACKEVSQSPVLIEAIAKIARFTGQRPILLPSSDEAARTISYGRTAIAEFADSPILDQRIADACLTKSGLHKAAERLDVPHPDAFFPEDRESLLGIEDRIDYPCVLKPDDSKKLYRVFGVKAFMVRSKAELLGAYLKCEQRGVSVFVQEYIPGDVTANHGFAAYFDRRSMPHCIVTYQRLSEWPRDSPGIASMAMSVSEPELAELGARLFSGLEFHGIVQAEFKRDSRDHKWKIIDVNPRAWTSNRLATASGCNIPYAAYAEYCGIPLQESYMRPQVRWVNFVDTAFDFLNRWRQGGLSLSDLRFPGREKVTYAVFDWNDPKPFVWFLRNIGWASRLGRAVRSQSGWGEEKTASDRAMLDAPGEAKLHSRQ
jgi:predicted ATP-grasp superfamily ATP-dependent carboligase